MSAFCGRYPECACKEIGKYCHIPITAEQAAILNESNIEIQSMEERKKRLEELGDVEAAKRAIQAQYEPKRRRGQWRGFGTNMTPPKKKRKKRH